METLYKEMQERLKYLEAQEETDENRYRIMELTLAIVRTQQLLLANVSGSVCDKCNGLRAVPSFGTFVPCDKCNK